MAFKDGVIMTSIETLEIKIDELTKRFEERMDYIEQRLLEKIDNTNSNMERLIKRCEHCPLLTRIETNETDIKDLQQWKYYLIAIIAIVTFIAPYVIPRLLS